MIYKYLDRKTNKIYEEKSVVGTPFLYKNPLGGLVLKVANKRFVSRIAGWYLNKKRTKKYIKNFIKDNNIDMSEYPKVEYKNFNEFFSRKILDGKRNFSGDKKDFCSPCDSKLQVFKIDENQEFVIKKHKYTLESILRDKKLASEYKNGYFMVFRLSVDDYHRYSFISPLYITILKLAHLTRTPVSPGIRSKCRLDKDQTSDFRSSVATCTSNCQAAETVSPKVDILAVDTGKIGKRIHDCIEISHLR